MAGHERSWAKRGNRFHDGADRAAPGRPGRRAQALYEALHPYVAYSILLFFAFMAAGFAFDGFGSGGLLAPPPLGIAAGLVLGVVTGSAPSVLAGVLTQKLAEFRRPRQ